MFSQAIQPSPQQVWVRCQGIRLRPVPEQAMCLAYKRQPPGLHGLNLTAWLVFELCDGRTDNELSLAYAKATRSSGGAGDARGALESALRQLLKLGLIERRETGKI